MSCRIIGAGAGAGAGAGDEVASDDIRMIGCVSLLIDSGTVDSGFAGAYYR
jgi:hypothetical protein